MGDPLLVGKDKNFWDGQRGTRLFLKSKVIIKAKNKPIKALHAENISLQTCAPAAVLLRAVM